MSQSSRPLWLCAGAAVLFAALLLPGTFNDNGTTRANQALRGSCIAVAQASICTEYYDFTPGYVSDLCGMESRAYRRGACPRTNVVGQCRLAGNITLYYSSGGSPYSAATARKHCQADGEARWEAL